MLRNNPRRAGLKALQAIKENSQNNKQKVRSSKSENPQTQGKKRTSSPTPSILAPQAKRNALGDVTNNKQQASKMVAIVKPIVRSPTSKKPPQSTKDHSQQPQSTRNPAQPPRSTLPSVSELNESVEASQASSLGSASQYTPVTAMQNVLQATTLSDSNTLEEAPITTDDEDDDVIIVQQWTDIDQAESHDPAYTSEYAPEIYQYMMERERQFDVQPYMNIQKDINPTMRTILVDWLIEVQENFELFHETLYLGVRLVDMYLSKKEVLRENLQLVGATCLLIASKFEELSPPLVDDFLYLCDDAYNRDQIMSMEREVLLVLGYDINSPVTYRFLRRLARAASATMETHTMARYIAEHSLQEYQFVNVRPSQMAAASMYLALRMKRLGGWTPTLQHYSGYTVESILPVVERLNSMLKAPLTQQLTVRSKYSHEVFFKVALAAPLHNVREDARKVATNSE